MKRRFAFTLKIICMFSMVFMLPSCENFFSGADAKHDIYAAVKFANAPTHDLRVFSETSETIPSGSTATYTPKGMVNENDTVYG